MPDPVRCFSAPHAEDADATPTGERDGVRENSCADANGPGIRRALVAANTYHINLRLSNYLKLDHRERSQVHLGK